MAAPEILLTEEQRLEFTQISPEISEWEIAKYYTFTDYDLDVINRHRRDYNRLGFAVQLAFLRYPGWAFSNVEGIPYRVLAYISEQVGVETKELNLYAQRENTRFEHLQEIREIYRYNNFSERENAYIRQLLFTSAMENDNAMYLMRMAVEELRKKKIILPGITTLEGLLLKQEQKHIIRFSK